MAGETVITVVGNLTDDPELRFTPSGAAVANFTVASTPRTLNKQTNEWEDGEAMFLRCSIWRQAAENVAESLQKGARVIVQGRMRARTWETREGEKRTSFEVDVDEIGPVAAVGDRQGRSGRTVQRRRRWRLRRRRQQSGGQQSGGQQSGGQAEDPWATPAPAQGGGQPAGGAAPGGGAPSGGQDPWGAPGVGGDEPPF